MIKKTRGSVWRETLRGRLRAPRLLLRLRKVSPTPVKVGSVVVGAMIRVFCRN